MDLKEQYNKDMRLFSDKIKKISILSLGENKEKLEAMWLLGCLNEICNQRIEEMNVTEVVRPE